MSDGIWHMFVELCTSCIFSSEVFHMVYDVTDRLLDFFIKNEIKPFTKEKNYVFWVSVYYYSQADHQKLMGHPVA